MNQTDKFEVAERSVRIKIIEFTELPEIQAQLKEAYFIWLNNPNLITDYFSEEELNDETFTKFFDWFLYDFRLLDSQKRVIERFHEENKGELTPAEVQIIKNLESSINSIFEVLEIIPGEGCKILDIFTNKKLYVVDKNASKSLSTSDLISARPFKINNIFYFQGLISAFPKLLKENIINQFNKDFEIYRNNYPEKNTAADYLKDWGYLITNYIEDLLSHPQYINADGEEFVIAKAHYKYSKKNDILGLLRQDMDLNEVSKINSALNVFILSDDQYSFLELEKNSLTIESNSQKKLEKIKSKLEKLLKKKITHIEDTIKNLNSFLDLKEKTLNNSTNKEMEKGLDQYYDEWINQPLERLKGKTPLESLKDEDLKIELETALTELEKLYEDAGRHGEPCYDVNRIRKKLKSN